MIPWQVEEDDQGTPWVHIELRSAPLWLVQSYLVKLGGQVMEEERHVRGEGWDAFLREGEPVALGSLRIGRGYLNIRGDDVHVLEELMSRLGWMLMRGGG